MSSNKPFPSSDLDVFKENSLILDNFVNSQENEHPDRFARKRPTITGIIKEAFNVRTDISNMNETLIGQSRWDAVPKNTSLSLGGDNGALNKQAQALFNRTVMLKAHAREGLRRTYLEVGLNLVEGSFEEGGVLQSVTDVLLEEKTGKVYSWSGSLPKVVGRDSSVIDPNWKNSTSVLFSEKLGQGLLKDAHGAMLVSGSVFYVANKIELDKIPKELILQDQIALTPENKYRFNNGVWELVTAVPQINSEDVITKIEADYKQTPINLKVPFQVQEIPNKNIYFGNDFVLNGFSKDASTLTHPMRTQPKFSTFGGQLRKLRKALTDPLTQFVSITILGDSNTWGIGTKESAVQSPRSQTIDDPRDYADTYTWVNILKDHIGKSYFGTPPVHSNWPSSPSGQSITTYTKDKIIFPRSDRFEVTVGPSSSKNYREREGSLTGWQYYPKVATTGYVNLKFTFTGKEFTIFYTGTADAASYELFINGQSKGVFNTRSEEITLNMSRKHEFELVKNAVIEIKVIYDPSNPGPNVQTCYFEGFQITKTCRVINQGIIGSDAFSFRLYNLINRKAVLPDDMFAFIQFGGNDRNQRYDRYPGGTESFRENMVALLAAVPDTCDRIIMASNDGANFDTSTFTRQEAKDTLRTLSEDKSLDFIDNWSIFMGMSYLNFTIDGTHMNRFGNGTVARNIISAIELA